MNDELKRVGAVFKARRKELQIGLKEIENSTSIRSNYLEAIEEGTIYEQISSVYAMGFMRQYASFLGVDIDNMIKDHPHVFRVPNEKHDFAYGIGTLEVRGSMGGGVKWLPNLVWALASAVILVLAWFLAKYLGLF